MRVGHPKRSVHQEHRNRDDDGRQHARRQNEEKRSSSPCDLETRKSIGGERAHAHRKYGRQPGNDQTVDEPVGVLAEPDFATRTQHAFAAV